jgi:hypothetical protein
LRIARRFAISFHTDVVAEYRKHGDGRLARSPAGHAATSMV